MNKHTQRNWSLKETSSGGAILHRPGGRQEYLQIFPLEDAKLIAAAPDLLEALKWTLARVENLAPHKAIEGDAPLYEIASARAAIARAEGKA